MNGLHDVGGMHGFGPVIPEAEKPIFHAEWHKRAMALTLAMGASGKWSLDQSRFARESLTPRGDDHAQLLRALDRRAHRAWRCNMG